MAQNERGVATFLQTYPVKIIVGPEAIKLHFAAELGIPVEDVDIKFIISSDHRDPMERDTPTPTVTGIEINVKAQKRTAPSGPVYRGSSCVNF